LIKKKVFKNIQFVISTCNINKVFKGLEKMWTGVLESHNMSFHMEKLLNPDTTLQKNRPT